MKFTHRHIILIITILFTSLGYSQIDKLKEADKMFEGYAFIDAQKIYLEVARSGYESENLFKKLGDSYYFNNDQEKALEWYQKLYDLNQNLSKEYLFRYAQSLKSVKRYKESDKIMLEFDALNETDSRVSKLKKERNYLELIDMQSGRFEMEKVSINSDYSEFSPSFFGKQLVFASNRPISSSVKRIHEWNNQPYLNLYSLDLSDSLDIESEPIVFSEELNSKFHESSAVFTKDGKTVYFTRNNFSGNKLNRGEDGVSYLKLFKSKLNQENTWTKPEELPFNSDNYSVAHPALSKDNKTLYFSSDMEGTIGMSDIFRVKLLEDDTYSSPENLGNLINTEGRENFPFVSDDGLLYFASDGHLGLGGLDVFVAVIKDKGELGEVFNLGRPINSNKDDFSFIINSKLRKGFFASNRGEGESSDNIYKINQLEKLMTACSQLLNGNIFTTNGEDALSDAKVELFDENLKLLNSTTTDSEGFYQFEVECDTRYVVRVSKDGFGTLEELVRTNSDFGTENALDFSVDKGDELGVTKADKGDDLSDLLQLDPIYFDIDKFQIRTDAEVELQKIIAVMKSYPEMRIDVRSHTDSRAGDSYNKILSDKRATATKDYIIEKSGISSERISGRGYGETQLVNSCSNGIDCSEAEHALNRRSEFIILNKNNTPEDIKKELIASEGKKLQQPKVEETPTAYFYDFENSTEELFTVQIGAFGKNSNIKFDNVQNVFSHVYSDGYKRYFSSVFQTRKKAEAYKIKLRNSGIDGAFVVGLKGETRF
ncbi:peptidoglycan-binding lipoprotein ion transport porin, OmpA family [Psychroflexus gondwanensis ACAM 44]|uniref:Peptidoglycan-binding lipoprotein ion transport porin, OmpA family n=1 Tax=Psychroflexus gondwanensis ACAM 44 TaxID=1189619 RepID=N1WY91_9FLAO|nr:OmpA family protein [Psychroflexus gondwanensis]EMY82167.1 peptidoglycan-binding lipoprotein ion transport porin, OmpA family [Psychroflexus gondwanensis ACAM 44]